MISHSQEHPLQGELNNLISSLDVQVAEMTVGKIKGSTQVHLILFCAKGLGIDLIAKAHKLILPRLEVLMDDPDIRLEVSSPGIGRKVKSFRELDVYRGIPMKLYSLSQGDWIEGIGMGIEDQGFSLKTDSEVMSIPLEDIQKAKLDN